MSQKKKADIEKDPWLLLKSIHILIISFVE